VAAEEIPRANRRLRLQTLRVINKEELASRGVMKKKLGGLDRSPIYLLHRAAQCASDIFQREFSDSDLTPRQLSVLIAVDQWEGLSQNELVVRASMDRCTLADMLKILVGRGWLERRRTRADARTYAIKLTDAGRLQLRRATPLATRVDTAILNVLPETEGERFIQRLQTLVTAFAARRPIKTNAYYYERKKLRRSSKLAGVGTPQPDE
jgi:DNA-binding MarR family transcriptional regulator